MLLGNGDLCTMEGMTQRHYRHAALKSEEEGSLWAATYGVLGELLILFSVCPANTQTQAPHASWILPAQSIAPACLAHPSPSMLTHLTIPALHRPSTKVALGPKALCSL